MAESTGFEPVRVLRLKGLAIPRIGPLCQLSKRFFIPKYTTNRCRRGDLNSHAREGTRS